MILFSIYPTVLTTAITSPTKEQRWVVFFSTIKIFPSSTPFHAPAVTTRTKRLRTEKYSAPDLTEDLPAATACLFPMPIISGAFFGTHGQRLLKNKHSCQFSIRLKWG